MKNETTHTPTPWALKDFAKLTNVTHGKVDLDTMEANRAYIVKCVNSHEDLIASMKEAIQSIENGAGIYAAGFLKDAIARAEGK